MYRFAPSPTQDLHIGNLRIALFNYICATKSNDKLIVRIEDIDKERNLEAKEREILDILGLFGIKYDQILYQSESLKFHRQLGHKLLMDANAFSCFCSSKILEDNYDGTCKKLSDAEVMANESPFVVRIKGSKDIDDFVILNVDKTPTYNFACAIDDMLSNIKVIIRSEDHLSDTPKQELIRKYLGYKEKIEYTHIPNIINDATTVKWLLEEGFLPDAIANYLILIGNKTPQEIFTLNDALEWFDLKNISKSPAKFDMTKLRELNREHIKLLKPLELSKFIGYSGKDIGELAKVYLEVASTINEIKDKIDAIFSNKSNEKFADELETLKNSLIDMPYCKEFDEFKNMLSQNSGLKDEKLFQPLRVLLTGCESGPDLGDIYPHIKNYLGEITKCS